jgi:pyrimidine-nucleoside phosphorylase
MSSPPVYRMYDLIYQKKLGGELSYSQLRYWIDGVINSTIPYEQSSAMLMAICWRGMTGEETSNLTLLMRDSGKLIDLSSVPEFKCEKHSTGGVGDSVSLVMGPIVAACGLHCPMLSGAGLGHTGN